MTMRLNNCLKCHGDVRLDHDQYGWYEHCIQCGFTRDLEPMALTQKREASTWHDGGKNLKPITPFDGQPENTNKGLH